MKKRCLSLIVCVFLSAIGFAQPKNIILVMADGVGYNHAQIMYNNKSFPNFDVQLAVCNYPTYWESLGKKYVADGNYVNKYYYHVNSYRGDYHVRRVWEEFDYADSLPMNPITAGSALATGVKPALDAVSYDMDGEKLETIIERAIAKGKATGLATDAALTSNNAVLPFISHAEAANSEGAYKKLITQLLTSNIDLVINSKNADPTGSNEHWTLTNSLDAFPTSFEKSVFFGKDNLSTTEYATASTKGLDALASNKNGFVFVSEFTKAARAAEKQDVDATISAMDEFARYIISLNNWVEQNSSWDETLMIVVGSYEQGYLTSKSFDKETPVSNFLSISSDDIKYNSEYSTNLLTPLFAKGEGSKFLQNYADETDYVLGSYISNTEIAQTIFRLMPNEIKKPKNIIFMVSDGCGISPIKAAEYYTGNKASFESFPVQLWNCTHASATSSFTNRLSEWNNTYESRLAWTDTKYFWKRKNATCSGASGTAMATGQKTYYYCLGVDLNKNALKSIGRYAKEIGKASGVATNSPYYDATPGSFFTNNASRTNYGELSRQAVIESNADVIIGCAHPEYDVNAQLLSKPDYTNVGGKEIIDGLRAGATEYAVASNSGWTTVRDIDGDGEPDPWTFVEDSASLVKYMTGETPKRLFGIMPVDGSMQFYRTGTNVNEVHYDDWNKGMPQLWQIGKTALNCLSKNEDGFFVMIENDMVDLGGHKNYVGRQIEEEIEFIKTVDSVIAWVEKNSSWDETLLIITADHETGFVADPTLKEDSIMLNHWQIIDKGKGNIPGMAYYSLDHTNQLVPLYAKGAGSELLNQYADEWDFVHGKYLNNSEIGQTMFELWNGTPRQFVNECPKVIFTDTVFIEHEKEFSITLLKKDLVADAEEKDFPVTFVSKPLWIRVADNGDSFVVSGTAPKATGTTLITFAANDGATTGAGLSLQFSIKVCVYKNQQPEAVETVSESTGNVYPTFALTGVTVRSETGNGTILVRNLQGKIVKSIAIQGEKTEVETADLPSGEYLIQIIENENVITKKIIVR
ncbi:MAG: alkaline phosphatase [Bacteroidales bacterium]|nr:alkaline phosphatase [Bacteroidales bacterium]